MRNLPRLISLCFLLVFVFASSVQAATSNVSITSTGFLPEDVTIEVGDIVVWTNEDTIDHEAMDDLVEWTTNLIAPSGTGSVTFDTAGTYTYSDTVDLSLVGTITVQAAAESSTTSSSSSSASTTTTTTTTTSQPVSGVEGPTLLILSLGGLLLISGIYSKKFV